jgi:hypothetical protein
LADWDDVIARELRFVELITAIHTVKVIALKQGFVRDGRCVAFVEAVTVLMVAVSGDDGVKDDFALMRFVIDATTNREDRVAEVIRNHIKAV